MSSKKNVFNLITLIVLVSSPLLFCMEDDSNEDSKKKYFLSKIRITTMKIVGKKEPLKTWSLQLYKTQVIGGFVKIHCKNGYSDHVLTITEPSEIKKIYPTMRLKQLPRKCSPNGKWLFFEYEGHTTKKLSLNEYLKAVIKNDPAIEEELKTCYNYPPDDND